MLNAIGKHSQPCGERIAKFQNPACPVIVKGGYQGVDILGMWLVSPVRYPSNEAAIMPLTVNWALRADIIIDALRSQLRTEIKSDLCEKDAGLLAPQLAKGVFVLSDSVPSGGAGGGG